MRCLLLAAISVTCQPPLVSKTISFPVLPCELAPSNLGLVQTIYAILRRRTLSALAPTVSDAKQDPSLCPIDALSVVGNFSPKLMRLKKGRPMRRAFPKTA